MDLADRLTPLPDELLDYAGIAALTGLRADTLRGYRRKGLLPEPDEQPTPDRPRWYTSTIREWLLNRPGPGRRYPNRR